MIGGCAFELWVWHTCIACKVKSAIVFPIPIAALFQSVQCSAGIYSRPVLQSGSTSSKFDLVDGLIKTSLAHLCSFFTHAHTLPCLLFIHSLTHRPSFRVIILCSLSDSAILLVPEALLLHPDRANKQQTVVECWFVVVSVFFHFVFY